MKHDLLSTTLTAVAMSFGVTFFANQPSYAEDTTFTCRQPGEEVNGEVLNSYTLTVSTPRTPEISLITWISDRFGPKYPPDTRCETVVQKLQRYYNCNRERSDSENPLDPKFIAAATFPWHKTKAQVVYYPVILTTLNMNPEIRNQCLSDLADNEPKIKGLLFMLPPEPDINQAAAKAKDVLDKLQDLRFYAVGDAIEN